MKLKLSPDTAALNSDQDMRDARLPAENKYHNKKLTVDGIEFDSLAEAARYGQLCLLQRAGEISRLETQPCYTLTVNGIKIGNYTADFRYLENGRTVVEDVKSVATKTPIYQLRKKLMLAVHGITIYETGAA